MTPTYNTMITAVTAGILVSTLAFADVLPQADEATAPAPASATAEPAGTPAKHSSLRCWQYGKLLFEQNGIEDNRLDERAPMQVFNHDGAGRDRQLVLFEMGSATCLYENNEPTEQPG